MEQDETAQILMAVFWELERTLKRALQKSFMVHLTPSQIFVLLRLMRQCKIARQSGGEHTLRVSELAAHWGVSAPAMTQILTGLEKEGYVTREMDPNDRRAIKVSITEKGSSLMQPAVRNAYSLFDGLSQELGEADTKKLAELMERTNWYFTEAGLTCTETEKAN